MWALVTPQWVGPGFRRVCSRAKMGGMCRNITELRGLEPPATDDEVTAAARQYIRKVTGLRQPPAGDDEAARRYEDAVAEVARLTADLLAALPPRRQPPRTVPPLRRPQVRARMGLPPLDA